MKNSHYKIFFANLQCRVSSYVSVWENHNFILYTNIIIVIIIMIMHAKPACI